jgi:hypothetical protein
MSLRTLAAVALASLVIPAAAFAQSDGAIPFDDRYPAAEAPSDGDYEVSVGSEGSSSASLSTFEAPLAAQGEWTTLGSYGPVWRPRVAAGWRPYYYGRWEWTTEGWLWVSDEPFGWATYHYGRWAFDRGFGWYWVPGYQWAPAWVSWRYSGDVVGWAPLAPGFSLYVTDLAFADFWWTFVPSGRFCGTPVYGVAYAPGYARRWYDATRPAPPRPGYGGRPGGGSHLAWGGPPSRFIEERLGRPLAPARIVASPVRDGERVRPGEIGVYRPEAARPSARPWREAPGRAESQRGRWDRGPSTPTGRPAAPDRTRDLERAGPGRGFDRPAVPERSGGYQRPGGFVQPRGEPRGFERPAGTGGRPAVEPRSFERSAPTRSEVRPMGPVGGGAAPAPAAPRAAEPTGGGGHGGGGRADSHEGRPHRR